MEALDLVLVLFSLALLAGAIDAIAGGGGLITIPALLWAGLDPVATLATNKAQAVFGSGMATLRFVRAGWVDPRRSAPAILCTFVGATLGAVLVQQIDSGLLAHLIPLLLIAFALYFWFSPRVSDLDSHQRIGQRTFDLTVAPAVGFYDGFFGPGTGTFFTLGQVALLGHNLRRATAHSKALNFTSNLAALLCFLAGGHIVWGAAAVMALGQMLGAWIGSHLVLRHGTALVRPLLVISSLAVSGKLIWERVG